MISAPAQPKHSDAISDRADSFAASDSWAAAGDSGERANGHVAPAPSDNAAAGVFEIPTLCQNVQPHLPAEESAASLLKELGSDPDTARRLAETATMPNAGAEFLGFRLLVELGRGAFARVFLAQQGDLAGRLVVLKVSAGIDEEPQTLAQLQHTNIVPIYSVHRSGRLQALCMPFFGAATLATVLRDLRSRKSLPNSGLELVDTLVNYRSTVRPTSPGSAAASKASASKPSASKPSSKGGANRPQSEAVIDANAPAGMPARISSDALLEGLKKFSYVEVVLWLGARLADGLAHAHERGILHRDLKPANILLTDEGQPMLLDFNLAQDTKQSSLSSAAIGGTLPYMSPEQLQAYRAQTSSLNSNSDLYSLGIILYELLTGRHPFEIPTGAVKHVLEKMIEQRRAAPPALCVWNKAVTPAVESIVQHCLQADSAKRYQSARELKEDLEAQLANLPLRHAPEPSLCERGRKWARRHPRLASSTSVAIIAGVLLLGLGSLLIARGNRIARLEATQTCRAFLEEKKTVQFLLTSHSADQEQVQEGLERCRIALGRYRVLDDPAWQQTAALGRLSDDEQSKVREGVGDLLLLMARSIAVQADPTMKEEQTRYALKLNRLAEACFAAASPAQLTQRAELTSLLGHTAEAKKLQEQARALPLQSARDYYLSGREHILQGQFREALPLLQQATQLEPQSFWAWGALGLCYDGLSLDAEAAAAYSTAIALWPSFHWAYYNRGIAYLKQKDFKRARADFDEVIARRPSLPEAFVNRALAWQGLENYKAAQQDLTHALELGTATRVYFMRARVRDKLGDTAGAKEDRAEGLKQEPADEPSWVVRGLARLPDDMEGALADFNKALELNPRSMTGLQNKAHVLSKQGRNEAALEVLNQAVAHYPDFVPARAGRGVILARLQKRDAAHKDAEECLVRDNKPGTVYQLAGIYALTSRQNVEDRQEAYRLLSSALRRGFGFELLEIDRDLDPIRDQPEFRRLVAVARALTATAAK